MTDRENIDVLAGEYVLGTLDAAERADVEARRAREPDLDAAIAGWEQKLAPMLDHVADATPSDLLGSIEARIADIDTGETEAPPTQLAEIVSLQDRLARWRITAVAASAIAASLLAFIFLRDPATPVADQQFVAVFQQDDRQPSFLLSINLETRELTIRPVAAETHPGKTYQLWIASDKLGPAPRSLGLLDSQTAPTHKQLLQFDPALLRKATFGISLEPAGGSPTGRPTGPAIHGTLIPAAS